MKLTLNKAAQEASISKSTLSEALKSGRLSAEKDEKGRYQIDPSELFRVFPKTSPNEQAEPTTNKQKNSPNNGLGQELEALRSQVQSLTIEREREREQLTDQIADLRRRLDTEGEERRKLTAMLTDQRATTKPERRGFFARLMGQGAA
jgi:predicted RNase H-like nuclease (RuvC/YqgF family)